LKIQKKKIVRSGSDFAGNSGKVPKPMLLIPKRPNNRGQFAIHFHFFFRIFGEILLISMTDMAIEILNISSKISDLTKKFEYPIRIGSSPE
jgi:hypothetical protein